MSSRRSWSSTAFWARKCRKRRNVWKRRRPEPRWTGPPTKVEKPQPQATPGARAVNVNELVPTAAEAKQELLEIYPKKVRRKRETQILVNDPEAPPVIGANSRTIPGIITQRGCAYAGCKGVV